MSADAGQPPLLPAGTAALAPFVDAGVLGAADVQVAAVVARTVPDTAGSVLLAVALSVRALGRGHVCLEVDRVAETVAVETIGEAPGEPGATPGAPTDALAQLPWPQADAWLEALAGSAAVTRRDPVLGTLLDEHDPRTIRPLVLAGRRVYLERYWRYERQVGDALLAPPPPTGATLGVPELEDVLDRYFGPDDPRTPDLQRRGAAVALTNRVAVLAGGPGTGKTHTVARLLAATVQLAVDAGRPVDVALAAPTGKAAARMTEAVHQAVHETAWPAAVREALLATEASTLHRLLGRGDGVRFRHDADHPLPHDVVVVDETSMVALPLMARLLDALRPDARLVLVGDPFQLVSVEAGAVLGDVVGSAARSGATASGPLADRIVVLERVHRFAADSAIAALAEAVRTSSPDEALDVLRDPDRPEVRWVRPDDHDAVRAVRRDVVDRAEAVVLAARAGDAERALELASADKVLCGTRLGPDGAHGWTHHLEAQLARRLAGLRADDPAYVGRPVIVTRNDPVTGVFNGDTGVIVERRGTPTVALHGAGGVRYLHPSQLAAIGTWWAMTIHKSQGSELDHAVLSLPGPRSRVLTNELLYTGITRGRRAVTVVATEAAIRAAITNPVTRASGLADRLWP